MNIDWIIIIADMRRWIADCEWRDLETEDVAALADCEVIAGVRRHYVGGVAQFVIDCLY